MPTIYLRWILGNCLRFVNNLSKKCPFPNFNRPKLDICTNLQKKHCIGEQILLLVMELLNNAHHIRQMDFRDLPVIWKLSIQNCPFSDFNRPKLDICTNLKKKHCIGEQIFSAGMELLNNAHHIRKMDFGELPQIWK